MKSYKPAHYFWEYLFSELFLKKMNHETDIIYCTSRFIFQLW